MSTRPGTTDKAAVRTPGGNAKRPTEIPRRGWVAIAKRGWKEAKVDQVPLLGAGVAFFGFIAIFPALVALISLYSLFADPATIAHQIQTMTQGMPDQSRALIINQIKLLSSRGRATLGLGAIISIVIALWSASSGVAKLITAITVAYDEEQKRGFIKSRALALVMTLGIIVFMLIMLTLVTAVSPLLQSWLGAGPLRWVLEAGRWVLIAILMAVGLALLYRIAPDRDAPQVKWVSVGAVVAAVIWLVASAGFSIYVTSFGNYAKTYGAFAGVIVLLLWLWISSYAILLGAEINAESEQQTIADTTKGPPEPLGSRGAVKADSAPPPPEDLSRS